MAGDQKLRAILFGGKTEPQNLHPKTRLNFHLFVFQCLSAPQKRPRPYPDSMAGFPLL